jgi:hypothetical protein
MGPAQKAGARNPSYLATVVDRHGVTSLVHQQFPHLLGRQQVPSLAIIGVLLVGLF